MLLGELGKLDQYSTNEPNRSTRFLCADRFFSLQKKRLVVVAHELAVKLFRKICQAGARNLKVHNHFD
jgi:hypothetical protein